MPPPYRIDFKLTVMRASIHPFSLCPLLLLLPRRVDVSSAHHLPTSSSLFSVVSRTERKMGAESSRVVTAAAATVTCPHGCACAQQRGP